MKSKWAKGLKSDQYNITELKSEIVTFEKEVKNNKNIITENDIEIKSLVSDIKNSIDKKEGFTFNNQ